MSGRIRCTDEFKNDAVCQVIDRGGYSVREVSQRLGVSNKSMYDWIKLYSKPDKERHCAAEQDSEIRRLRANLARVAEERDLKKSHGVLRARIQVKYAFIEARRSVFTIRTMWRMFKAHHSGFYAWLKAPLSNRAKNDVRLIELLKQAWQESGCVYGYRKIHDDLRSAGETCCPNRIA